MKYYRSRRAFSQIELIATTVIAIGLGSFVLPLLRHNQKMMQQSRTSGIAVTLKQIESAKQLYVAEHRLKLGAPVQIRDLTRRGYLSTDDLTDNGISRRTGVHYVAGNVGSPAEYHQSGEHAR